MLTGGVKALEVNRPVIDELNVFPVPDGDTGTNMSLTLASALREYSALGATSDLGEIASAFSKGALHGARGNSGVILSQILKGFSVAFDAKIEADAKDFATALRKGTEIAYGAVQKPKEGTILTVVRIMAETATSLSRKRKLEFEDFLAEVIKAGETILMRTPEMLPVLAKAGVVDAGGRGLVTMFEGMLSALTGSEIRLLDASKTASGPVETGAEGARQYTSDVNDYENITFQYCTEYFITHMGSDVTVADIDRYRDYLCTIGDCVLVIGDLDLVKTHVHTNTPDRAIKAALKLGELDGIKIENMMEQHRKIVAEREKNEQKPVELRPYGMVSVCAGEGMDAIFRDLQTDVTIEGGQTMNPSVYDILNAVNSTKAKDVFVLPNNSNIILAAEQAKELADVTVHVIPTRNMPEGISAALAFSPEASPEENEEMMTEAFRGIMTAEITHAVRSTRMNGFSVKEGDIIGISSKKIIAKGASVQEVAVACASKLLEGGAEMITAYYGSDISESEAERMLAIVAETHPDAETAAYYGGQPHYYYILAAE